MFKKLKDKIAEELKDGEQRIQQIAQAAQVCLHFAIFLFQGISPSSAPPDHSHDPIIMSFPSRLP